MFGVTILEALLVAGVAIAIPSSVIYVVFRAIRSLQGSAVPSAQVAQLEQRIMQLEDTLSHMSMNIEQLAESQAFTTRVLTERSGPDQPGK